MKRLFQKTPMMIFALLFTVAGAANAQSGKHTPEERAKQMTEKMKAEIPLEDNQYAKVYELNLEQAKQMQDLRKNTADKSGKMDAMKTLKKERNQKLEAILSPDQMKKYHEIQKEKRHAAMEKRKNRTK